MLQIKNTLGGGKPEGLYAWKKYDLVKKYNINSVQYSTPSNPIDVTALCNKKDGNFYLPCFSSNSYTVNSEGYFEFSNIASRKYISIPSDGSTIDFDKALGTYRYFCLQSTNFPDKGSDLIMSPTANEIFDQNMADSYTYAKYDSSTNRVIVYERYASNYFIGLTTEEYYEPNSFLNYIVSDKETAYPDGGEKGGYWYEKVSEGITPEMFGCTKMAVDKFTLSSRKSCNGYTISHSLNAIPKFMFIIAEKKPTDYYDVFQILGTNPTLSSEVDKTLICYYDSGILYTDTVVTNSITSNQFKVNNSTFKYTAGIEYTVITMV